MSQFFHSTPTSGPKSGAWRRGLPRTWRAALDLPDAPRPLRIEAGTYPLGPENGTLSVRTGRTGAVAKAGHDLLIHVTAWTGTLEIGEDAAAHTSIVLDADPTSLQVREGTGGMQQLDDDDKAGIAQTINEEILMGQAVEFRSTSVQPSADGGLSVQGDLTLVGATRPVALDATIDDGRLRGSVVVKQSDWGIKPYSALFGALKVADEIELAIDVSLPSS